MDNNIVDIVASNYSQLTGNSDTAFLYNLAKTTGGEGILRGMSQQWQTLNNVQQSTTEQHGIALNAMIDQIPIAQNNLAQNINAKTIGGGGSVGQILNTMNNQTAAQETQMGIKVAMQNQQLQSQKQTWANNVSRLANTTVQ